MNKPSQNNYQSIFTQSLPVDLIVLIIPFFPHLIKYKQSQKDPPAIMAKLQ